MKNKNTGSILPELPSFSERLLWARKRKGLTQEQLGDMTCYSYSTIGKMEKGQTKTPRKVIDLAKALDVPPAWLQFGTAEIDNLDERSIKFALKFQALENKEKNKAEALFDIISD